MNGLSVSEYALETTLSIKNISEGASLSDEFLGKRGQEQLKKVLCSPRTEVMGTFFLPLGEI